MTPWERFCWLLSDFLSALLVIFIILLATTDGCFLVCN